MQLFQSQRGQRRTREVHIPILGRVITMITTRLRRPAVLDRAELVTVAGVLRRSEGSAGAFGNAGDIGRSLIRCSLAQVQCVKAVTRSMILIVYNLRFHVEAYRSNFRHRR